MKKVFLYLYPVRDFMMMYLFHNDKLYDEWKIKRPLPILNECIQKRYRDQGYEVVFAMYPDKKVFGVDIKEGDKVIYTDISFIDATAYDDEGKEKDGYVPIYPNEILLLSQLGNVDELVVSGFHVRDCVARVGDAAINMGIKTLIDVDLTDYFFGLYRQENYFKIDEYNPQKFKNFIKNKALELGEDYVEVHLKDTYLSKAFGFDDEVTMKM